ncbi:alpha/beta fold hydrolase [Tenggerimyces flavus]|uniref:Alpha/beta fold hydrolase n=1 Tax=Tenggerimyces flavus TaxID=1708749 RepID=A0ABV7YPZ7_9ACTN|nr:alpha/beta hydrolase [Tenggerimyces flavus]MBM7784383.1 pimeloyl-ACP methyl ester carboxylesterase [Tenggerimyces flavus]
MITRGRTEHLAWVRTRDDVDTVFLHGFSDNADVWLPWFDQFPSRGSLAIDSRGHGQSGLPEDEGGASANAADVALVLGAQEIPAAGVVLIGHSMGAVTAAATAGQFPELVRAVVLEDPPFPTPPVPDATQRSVPEWFLAERARSLEERIENARARNPAWSDDEIEPQARSTGELDQRMFELPVEAPVAMSERLTRVTCPVLVIHGDVARGSTTSPEQAEALRNAAAGELTIAHVPDAGHNIRRDQRSAYLAVVNAFLDGL